MTGFDLSQKVQELKMSQALRACNRCLTKENRRATKIVFVELETPKHGILSEVIDIPPGKRWGYTYGVCDPCHKPEDEVIREVG